MTKKTGAYIVMIAGLILIILNKANLDFGDLKADPFTGWLICHLEKFF